MNRGCQDIDVVFRIVTPSGLKLVSTYKSARNHSPENKRRKLTNAFFAILGYTSSNTR
jgi:hypothetical protein